MVAAASSANSVSSPPLPKKELKQEDLQDVSSEIKDVKEVKTELGDSKEVKRESVDTSKKVKRESVDSKEVKIDPVDNPFEFLESKEHTEKFQKYEADFKQYLITKYFSDKTIFGGNIFDVKTNPDGKTIRASRLPPYQSYLDPATFQELLAGKETVSSADTSAAGSSNAKPSI